MMKRALIAALVLALTTSPLSAAWCGECLPWDCTMSMARVSQIAVDSENPEPQTSSPDSSAESHCAQTAVGNAVDTDTGPDGSSELADGERCPAPLALLTDDCCASIDVADNHEALVTTPRADSDSGDAIDLVVASEVLDRETTYPTLPLPQSPPPQQQLFTLHSVLLI